MEFLVQQTCMFFFSIATQSLFFSWIKPDFRPIEKHEIVSFKERVNDYEKIL